MKPLWDLHRVAAQQTIRPSFGEAKTRAPALSVQASPAGTSIDSGGTGYLTAYSSVGEENQPMGVNARGAEPDWVEELHSDVRKQMRHGIPPLRLSLGNVATLSTPSNPSPLARTSTGKNLDVLIAAPEKEKK